MFSFSSTLFKIGERRECGNICERICQLQHVMPIDLWEWTWRGTAVVLATESKRTYKICHSQAFSLKQGRGESLVTFVRESVSGDEAVDSCEVIKLLFYVTHVGCSNMWCGMYYPVDYLFGGFTPTREMPAAWRTRSEWTERSALPSREQELPVSREVGGAESRCV